MAFLTLNRPSALNAANAQMRAELMELVAQAERDSEVRVIVLRGAGERAFCAGADIHEFEAVDSPVVTRAAKHAPKWIDAIAAAKKPTMASIHGYCLGGGLEMALACDLRIASDDAVFALPETRLGIIPGAGGTQRLARVVGMGNALRLILTGDRIDATTALQMGLVSAVVAPADRDGLVRQWAERCAEGAPLALAYAKEAVRRGLEMPLADGLRLEADLATLLFSTKDRSEGAAAFREHRKPVFRGE